MPQLRSTLRRGTSAALACVATALALATPADAALRWPAPQLVNPTTIDVTETNSKLRLDQTKDYIVRLPADRPLTATGGLVIAGGHNVVLVGGEISIPYQGPTPGENDRRGLYLTAQTGTMHVEGVRITGSDLNEGINLDQRAGAIVQLQYIQVENVHPRDDADRLAHHSDILQTWAGPAQLRVDHLTGSTSYQGFFLIPTQYGALPAKPYQLVNIDLTGLPGSAYMLWKSSALAVATGNLWITPPAGRTLQGSVWGPLDAWGDVRKGPRESYVSSSSVGLAYAD